MYLIQFFKISIFEVLFYWISLLCAKCFGQDCLSKQIFGLNSTQSPSNLGFWTFSVASKHFFNHHKNIKQVSCIKVLNIMVSTILYLWFRSKFDFRKHSTLTISCFLEGTNIFEPEWVLFQTKYIKDNDCDIKNPQCK